MHYIFFIKIHIVFKVNIWWRIVHNLLKCSHFEFFIIKNYLVLSSLNNLKWYFKTWLHDKNKRNISFLPLINSSLTSNLFSFSLLCTSAIISKTMNHFSFFVWVVFFNIFINIIYIIRVFNKRFRIIKCFKPVLSCLLIRNWYFAP